MNKRITKVYTKTGDKGSTTLGDMSQIEKEHPRIEAIGDVDELNSWIGMLLSLDDIPETTTTLLTHIQHKLFDLGGELSIPDAKIITLSDIEDLEENIDVLNLELAPLEEFVLPGGCFAAATCHLARTVCRRAERKLFLLNTLDKLNPNTLIFMNRLSDLLFVIARTFNKIAGMKEEQWEQGAS